VTKQERFQQKQWGQIVARSWAEPEFKDRLVAEPQAVLREYGIEAAADVQIRVVEDTAETQYLVLPARPSDELVEEELVPTTVGYCYCGYSHSCWRCGRCGCGCA
jgi:hypothetical protein